MNFSIRASRHSFVIRVSSFGFSPYDTRDEMSNLRGKFIVLDGGEGCGKSTQMQLLADRLATQGLEAIRVHDPGATPIGEKIRAILLNPENSEMSMRCEMLLYMSARAQLMFETILPALRDGKVVICDRFVSSTSIWKEFANFSLLAR